ncbi:proline-rich protein 27 [Arvicola amphibius]|uniref:proline-rich protein 27 n=1 Tax=Arvicola amphibius TaxID=1047088 RepID=UPI001C0A4B51|nr:proline-rich protein 27 [Arvicola amphibius]
MKLLLWACIICLVFAKRRRYPFIHKKSPSPSEEDYFGHRYPLNPSLNIPYGLWNDNLPPFLLPPLDNHQGNTITKFPGNSELERGLSPYPWILTSKVHYAFQNPNYPSDTSLNGPTVSAPLPPPPPPPPRPYPFVIPPKISVSPVTAEPGATVAVPAVGEAMVPEISVDKTISGLPTAVKFGPPLPLPEPKAPPAEPVPAQFAAPEPAAAQFAPEPIGVAEPTAGHPVAPEPPTLPSVAAAQLIPAEPTPGQSAENKAASGEPAVAQAIPVEPVVGPAAEVRPPALDPAGSLLPPAELIVSQSAVGKPFTSESPEVKPEGAEPVEAKSGSQEPLPFVLYQAVLRIGGSSN